MYKSSYYNFVKDQNDSKVIYNTKTGSVSMIDEQSSDRFMDMLTNPRSDYEADDLFQSMIEEGYIIKEEFDELDDLRELNQLASTASHVLRLTILPTETCNFTCPYCFIYTLRNKHMVAETWDALYKLCQNFCEKNKDKSGFLLNLIWYGGEPLIVSDKIISFMAKIKELLRDYPNGNLRSNIVTNGYLLDYATFQKLCDVNVRQFQVTLDGDAENHDKLRTLANKKPTFDKIYSNLLEIVQKVSKNEDFGFAIRCNFLKSSVPSSRRLLDEFQKDFAHDNRFHIYFRPVYDFETDRNSDDIEESDFFNMTEGVEMQNELLIASGQDIKHAQSVSNPLPEPMSSWCDSVNQYAYIIGYDGAIYICDTMITDRKDAVGILKEDGSIELNEKAERWRRGIFDRNSEADAKGAEECIKCKLLPVCMGGCVRARMKNKGNACFWNEELIYKAMDEYVKMYK